MTQNKKNGLIVREYRKEGTKKMDAVKCKSIIEAVLYAAGRPVEARELMFAVEKNYDELDELIETMKQDMEENNSGLEII